MSFSILKKADVCFSTSKLRKKWLTRLTMIVSVILLSFFSLIFFSNSFNLCVYLSKINFYCISGTIQSGVDVLHMSKNMNGKQKHSHSLDAFNDEKEKQKEKYSKMAIEENLKIIRSWVINDNNYTSLWNCENGGIFVYDLPSKFNKDLIAWCSEFFPWANLCDHFSNDGKGLPIPELGKLWYHTFMYSLELIFHSRIMNHPCRVDDYNAAKLFYVPYYGGLDIMRWHFKNVTTETKDKLGIELIEWLQKQQPWIRSSGKDHMFVFGMVSWDFRRKNKPWGSNFLLLEQMQAPYKFIVERQPWEVHDIGIPYPTHFHPITDADIEAWISTIANSDRPHLVSFAGSARSGNSFSIRSVLIQQCVSEKNLCRFLDCSQSATGAAPEDIIKLFMKSEFCLQPIGDSPTRKSVFDSLIAGCIPVLFNRATAYYQYPWYLPEDYSKYSVFIAENDIRDGKVNVVEILKNITLQQREEMRNYVVYELMPGLVYGDSNAKFDKYHDAFDIAIANMIHHLATSH